MQLITSHLNTDFDSLASMIAVRKLYPQCFLQGFVAFQILDKLPLLIVIPLDNLGRNKLFNIFLIPFEVTLQIRLELSFERRKNHRIFG